jgi:hypothetical protein
MPNPEDGNPEPLTDRNSAHWCYVTVIFQQTIRSVLSIPGLFHEAML